MFLTNTFKAVSVALVFACASCSSSGQSGQKTVEVEQAVQKTLLNVGLRRPEASASVSSSVVQFYVSNETSMDANVLIWGTPIEKRLSADVFTVTKNGVVMPYLGRMVKRGSPSAQDYMKLVSGDSLETLIDVANYYDMSATGKYTVQLNLPKVSGGSRLNQETTVALDDAAIIVSVGN